jgi:hypothetical protein
MKTFKNTQMKKFFFAFGQTTCS